MSINPSPFRGAAGFTMIHAMLVVTFIGVIVAVVLPDTGPNHREQALARECITRLVRIQAAKEAWALDHHQPVNAIPAEVDLAGPDRPREELRCPAGGTVRFNVVNQKPVCSIPGHKLD